MSKQYLFGHWSKFSALVKFSLKAQRKLHQFFHESDKRMFWSVFPKSQHILLQIANNVYQNHRYPWMKKNFAIFSPVFEISFEFPENAMVGCFFDLENLQKSSILYDLKWQCNCHPIDLHFYFSCNARTNAGMWNCIGSFRDISIDAIGKCSRVIDCSASFPCRFLAFIVFSLDCKF